MELSDSIPDTPELTSWVNELGLSVVDKNTLVSGKWLTANHMSAANYLLKTKYPCQNGLQDTCALVQKSRWLSDSDSFVQIIYIKPGHWAVLSNKYCSPGNVNLYDSLHTVPICDGGIMDKHAASSVISQLIQPW